MFIFTSITVKPAPDLTPGVYVTPAIQYGSSAFSIVVDVFELYGSPTNPSRKITAYINKNSYAQVQADPGGTPGIHSVGATISPSSGGELRLTNNVDADKITYFGQ